jgi:protein associated with RNAse G/E
MLALLKLKEVTMPKIFRIRYIPSEVVDISNDHILHLDSEIMVTEWLPIKPRKDFHHGMSCLYIHEGYKVSLFMDESDAALYWYCDIIDVVYDLEEDTFKLYDLLADVRIKPDGAMEVIDLDELADAVEMKLITENQLVKALRVLDTLLKKKQDGSLPLEADGIMKKYRII